MKDPAGLVRSWLYTLLNTNVSYGGSIVPVHSFAPKDAAMPYILLAQQSTGPEGNHSTKDSYVTDHSFTLEIYSSHTGNDASYVPTNTISNSAMQLVRNRSDITIEGYNIVSCVLDNAITDNFLRDDNIIIIKVLNFTLIIEELAETGDYLTDDCGEALLLTDDDGELIIE